jgi:tetratricopeptide (TPR) repeat protein
VNSAASQGHGEAKFTEAKAVCREGTDLFQQAAADFPHVTAFRTELGPWYNQYAWFLATCPDGKLRKPSQAVELAKKATELAPKVGNHWNTLGVAYYRAGDWQATARALEKSIALRQGGDAYDWLFLAMAHWQLGHHEEARQWYHRAIAWIDKNKRQDEELSRFRAEARTLFEPQGPEASKDSETSPRKD